MRVNRLLVLSAVLATMALCIANPAYAGALNVQNHSFELPTVAAPSAYNLEATNWTNAMSTGGNFWPISDGSDGFGGQLTGGDGTNVYAWIGEASYANPHNAISQNLVELNGTTPINYQEGYYTLSAMLAKRADSAGRYIATDTMVLGLFKASDDPLTATPLASTTVPVLSGLSDTSFTDVTARLHVTDPSLVGQQIKVAIISNVTEMVAAVTADNVRMSYSTTPEPGTFALLATGLFGLLAYAWRKRRN
jgi:hypothetical protein